MARYKTVAEVKREKKNRDGGGKSIEKRQIWFTYNTDNLIVGKRKEIIVDIKPYQIGKIHKSLI